MKKILCIALLIFVVLLAARTDSEEAEQKIIDTKEDYFADIEAARIEGYDDGYCYGYGEGLSDGREEGYEFGYDLGYEEGYYSCLEEYGLTEPSETRGFARIEKEPE